MTQITAALVKELRESSGAGMMDCKKALSETHGDLEAAVDWLRKKGLSTAAKKSGRAASEGLVGVVVDGLRAAVVELNAETDFVARNAQFQDLVEGVTQAALGAGHDLEALKVAPFPSSERCVADEVTHAIASIGENMNLRRSALLEVASGAVAGYVHTAVRPGLGRIGVLVALESTGDVARLAEVGRQIAMHVAAASPLYLDRAAVDPVALERERDVLSEQARTSGKPEDVIAKMVEGRLRKFYEEVCLLDQTFVIDGERRVSDVIDQLAKELGTPVVLKGFVRFVLGDGVEKQQSDFAAEVAAAAGVGV